MLIGCLIAGGLVACTAPIAQGDLQAAESIEAGRIQTHYNRLNAADTNGRRTATVGYATAASYVAQRLAGYGIQPLHPGEYRHLSYGPINHVRGMTLRHLGADSTIWGRDAFMLPDPRTAGGIWLLESFRRIDSGIANGMAIPRGEPGMAAVLKFRPPDSLAVALADAGYQVIVVLGVPRAGRSSKRLPSGIVQMVEERWARVAGGNATRLEGSLQARLTIEAEFDPAAAYVHVMGILPGSHPVERNRLVVLGANLDSGADPAGPTLLDPDATGIAASALLEAARVLGMEEDQGKGQPHSILVAWWAGGAQDNAGLKGFMATPPWSSDALGPLFFAGRPDEALGGGIVNLGRDPLQSTTSASPVRARGTELAAAYYRSARTVRR